MRERFLGPVMYLAAVDPLNAHWSPRLVYDGQQRLTTVTLILEALARHLKDDDAPDGFEPAQIGNDYLFNAHRKGERHYRLILKPGDAETLLALIHRRPLPAGPAKRILEAFAFFEKRIVQLGPDMSALCAGLRKLRIVAFDLKEGEDNPHRVFETMNACGRDLSCADMIGNFILMPLDRERQDRLYADHLRPIERGFERHGGEHFDAFIRHYLTLGTGEVPRQGEEYAAFRTHAASRRVRDAGPEALASDLRTRADHYRAIALGEEPDADLAHAFADLASLDMKPAWPFLLHLYGDYSGGRLSKHDLLSLIRAVLPPTSPISGFGATATCRSSWITSSRPHTRWNSSDRPTRASGKGRYARAVMAAAGMATLPQNCPMLLTPLQTMCGFRSSLTVFYDAAWRPAVRQIPGSNAWAQLSSCATRPRDARVIHEGTGERTMRKPSATGSDKLSALMAGIEAEAYARGRADARKELMGSPRRGRCESSPGEGNARAEGEYGRGAQTPGEWRQARAQGLCSPIRRTGAARATRPHPAGNPRARRHRR